MVLSAALAALAFPTSSLVIDPPPPGTVTVNVVDKNDTVAAGGSVTVDLISGSSASDGSSLRVTNVTTVPNGRGTRSWNDTSVTYNPATGITGNTTLSFTLTASTGAIGAGTVTFVVTSDPVVENPTRPTVSTFYKVGFNAAGKDPGSGHGWNIGTMATNAKATGPTGQFLGFQPRISGGKCFKIPAGDSSGNETRTWDEVSGGPIPNGAATPVAAMGDILTRSQASVHLHGSTRAGIRRNDNEWDGTTWVWLGLTFLPFGAAWQEVEYVIEGRSTTTGTNRYNRLFMLGKRIRFIVDNFGKPYKQVICRLMYEFNQNTALALEGGLGFFQVAANRGLSRAVALQKWKAFLSAGIRAFWDGYGYEMAMALSPALETTMMPQDYTIEELLVPETIIVCGSFHPIPPRIDTVYKAYSVVYGTDNPKWFQPIKIVTAARNTGRVAAFLEHSVGLDNPDFFGGNLANADLAYQWFGHLLNENDDIMAFTGVLGNHMSQPNGEDFRARHLRAPPAGFGTEPTATQMTNWRNLALAHRDGFTASAAASGSAPTLIPAHPGDDINTYGFGRVNGP